MPTMLRRADALEHIYSGLEMMSNVADAINLPLVKPIISSILGIVEIVKQIRGDKQRCGRLINRAYDFARGIQEAITVDVNVDASESQLAVELLRILTVVSDIHADLDKWSKEKTWKRFLSCATLSQQLDDHFDALDSA
ncbi:hypothetical protein OBBRIDRAFT_832826 [Obba rivulosa]|uniref:Uncharacterized protein n=1 Tax=Obba rivulosa TaxID=1052685 RepID=A0A8E2B1S8_9APHY|nr:hypothetical protein OBBRIDRAFT_832826 [Obba rivulosa]